MLVLKRRDGEWVELEHVASGDIIRLRTYDIQAGATARVSVAFDDPEHHFAIRRPERGRGEVSA